MWLAGAEPALTPLVARSMSVKPGILDMVTAVSCRQVAAADQASVGNWSAVCKEGDFPFLQTLTQHEGQLPTLLEALKGPLAALHQHLHQAACCM